jgi:hypothetical protein
MSANERRFWPRPEVHLHVLGEVRRIFIGQTEVRALMLYEQSVERDQVPAELPALRGKLIGDMDAICCTVCGQSVADWHIGEDAMEALLNRIVST